MKDNMERASTFALYSIGVMVLCFAAVAVLTAVSECHRERAAIEYLESRR